MYYIRSYNGFTQIYSFSYSQSISIVKALKQGIGGKVLSSLKKALELQPLHAEAHTALALYHAEIIDKIGKLIGGLTYGASEASALEHFERALELTPGSPIAHIEFGLYTAQVGTWGPRPLDDGVARDIVLAIRRVSWTEPTGTDRTLYQGFVLDVRECAHKIVPIGTTSAGINILLPSLLALARLCSRLA